MNRLHPTLERVTDRIRKRSRDARAAYLSQMRAAAAQGPTRHHLSCSNLAHGFAACGTEDKAALKGQQKPNIAIVSAYNDMLSAHQPLETYPRRLKDAIRAAGGVAQFAGGVPAMCDGVTQGQAGMELSLFSRDVIAQSTAIALSHDMFDGVICLGVCDKIVPGLLIGALSFGHLPVAFLPAGPMPSGLPNREKAKVRQLYAEGKVGKQELLEAESASYHAPGTCTFYGTANSNQMFMEILGLHLPGASFVPPNTPLRNALIDATGRRVCQLTALGESHRPLCDIIDERAIVNATVGLLATGGSTNHTLHLIAMARAAGVRVNWDDFDELSAAVPLLARVYPNGSADVNHFHQAGGLAYLIRQLLGAGLLHGDVTTLADEHTACGGTTRRGLEAYTREVDLDDGQLVYRDIEASRNEEILRPASNPFQPTSGLRLLTGNLGRAVIKTSAVKPEHHRVEAPAVVFDDQFQLVEAFEQGKLDRNCVVVVRFQGPRANGMPELHKLMPPLGVLQDRGYRIALVTDGRLSGASGKVPCAIHVTPEAAHGGPLTQVRDGDLIRVDPEEGVLAALVDHQEWNARKAASIDLTPRHSGVGRELFGTFRATATGAEEGAVTFGW